MSASFDRLATVTASTKRPPAFSEGKRGDPVEHIASLQCWPLDPVDPEVKAEYRTGRTRETLQTFVPGCAVRL